MTLDNKTTAIIGVLVLVLAVPTGAVVTGSSGTDDVWESNGIVLEPAPGPNGEYASVDGANNLTVDLSDPGLNLDAITEIERIFAVRNTGDDETRVWLTHDGSDHVVFTESATGNPVQDRNDSRVLEAGESVLVGVHVDTQGPGLEANDTLLESIRVHAEPTAETQPTTQEPTAEPTTASTAPAQTTAESTTAESTTAESTTDGTTTPQEPGPGPDSEEENETVTVDFGEQGDNATVSTRDMSVDEITEPAGDGDPRPTARITNRVEDGTQTTDEPPDVRVNNTSVQAVTTVGEPVDLEGDQSLLDTTDSVDVERRIAKVVDISPPAELEHTSATVRIRLNRSRLQDTAPENARIGHRTEQGWQLLDTRVVDRTEQSVTLQTRTPGFSVFAVFRNPEVTYTWELPDGSTYAGPQVRSVFDEPGVYNVSLTVTDAYGQTDTTDYRILANDRPDVSIDAPDSIAPDESVTLRANVSNEYGNVTVSWLLPNGREVTGTSVTTAFQRGEQPVEVRVRDEFGASRTAERTIPVGVSGGDAALDVVQAAQSPLGAMLGLLATLTVGYLALRRRTGDAKPTGGRDWTWPWNRHRAPRIERLENPHWNPTRGRFEIDRLAVTDPGNNLETVEIIVKREDGRELARKTIDMRLTSRYEVTGESVPGIGVRDVDLDDRYLVTVRAVDADEREDSTSQVVETPRPAPGGGTPASAP